MPTGTALLERAVELALRAPSIHNTQPWRWRFGTESVELHADPGRHLPSTDPDRRDLLVSCGAALHHLRVAVAGLGAGLWVDRLPDPERPDHLATATLTQDAPDPAAAALFGQLGRRRTDRRMYAPDPVPAARIAAVVAAARDQGVEAMAVEDRHRLAGLYGVLDEAARRQPHEPGYLAELLIWTHRYAGGQDGVLLGAVPRSGPDHRYLHRFPEGSLPGGTGRDGGLLLALLTADDGRAARLAAGQATSAVLLTATREGLATAPLSQAVEVPAMRDGLRRALGVAEHPQLMIRVGIPPHGPLPPESPRRSLQAVTMF